MTARLRMKIAVTTTVALSLSFAGTTCFAASPPPLSTDCGLTVTSEIDPAPTADVAQRAFDNIKARYVAGVATTFQFDQAKAALEIAQADHRLQEARALYQRQSALYTAGVISTEDVAASHLSVTASEVALNQARLQEAKQATEHGQKLFQAGIGTAQDVNTATAALNAVQNDLRKAQSTYKAENLALSALRLRNLQTKFRVGIGTQAAIDRAEADYDTAAAIQLPATFASASYRPESTAGTSMSRRVRASNNSCRFCCKMQAG